MESPNLVVNVVIVSIAAREPLQGVERQGVSAVVIDGLEGGNCEKKRSLTKRHPSQPLGDHSTRRVEDETLDRVVVPSPVRIWHIQPMMPGVDSLEQECVHVHGAVQEVLPSVDEKTAKYVGELNVGQRWA